jgi:hypothetical protein
MDRLPEISDEIRGCSVTAVLFQPMCFHSRTEQVSLNYTIKSSEVIC